VPAAANGATELTSGLARNTFFNFSGWIVLAALAFLAVPFTVSRLGIAAYGVFSIVSVVSGYFGALHTPTTEGGVRFMAAAYGRGDWSALRSSARATAALACASAAIGALIMAMGAPLLVRVFRVPSDLSRESEIAFRLGALTLLLSATSNSLSGMLAATRRFGTLNLIAITTRTLSTAAVLTALAIGGGLVQVIRAQAFASLLTLVTYAALVVVTLRGLPSSPQSARAVPTQWRSFMSFSGVLLLSNVGSVLGLQLDRAVVGSMLGAVATGYYSVPARLTDYLLSLIASLTEALYPLSSEAAATSRLAELRELYVRAARLLTWFAAFSGSLLIVPAADILQLWVGPDISGKAWPVLACLAATAMWRAPSSIAYRVCNGLGRADLTLRVAWGTLASTLCLVIPLTVRFGIAGTAAAVLLGQIPLAVAYDLVVQRTLLGQRDWSMSWSIYLKPVAVTSFAYVVALGVPLDPGWASLGVKVAIVLVSFAAGATLLDRGTILELRGFGARVLRLARPSPTA
jgi:O-antigen/teichoic acid export membrane protein